MKKKPQSSIERDLKKLETFAKKEGALIARRISVSKVVVDERAYYKCLYGCPSYDSSKMCPPNTPHPSDFERVLRKYRWGVLVQTYPPDINRIAVAVEREALLQGYYFALALRGGPCMLCEECTDADEPCRNPEMARPAMEAVGIDVFATLKNARIPAAIKKTGDEEWFFHGLILVE